MSGTLQAQWKEAVDGLDIRHIDPTTRMEFRMLGDAEAPRLQISVFGQRDADDQDKRVDRHVHTMNLRYWPGFRLAQTFLACAWASFFQHEALELCFVDGERVWDPHRPPYVFDQGFRRGMPVDVTPETLERTLALVMGVEHARVAMEAYG